MLFFPMILDILHDDMKFLKCKGTYIGMYCTSMSIEQILIMRIATGLYKCYGMQHQPFLHRLTNCWCVKLISILSQCHTWTGIVVCLVYIEVQYYVRSHSESIWGLEECKCSILGTYCKQSYVMDGSLYAQRWSLLLQYIYGECFGNWAWFW